MLTRLIDYFNQDKMSCYRYLFVDPLKPIKDDELLALVNIKEVFPKDEVIPVLRSDLFYDPDYCPHLILLAKPNEDIEVELLQLTLERSHREQTHYKHYICGWLSSELSIDLLADKLVEYGNQLGEIDQPNTHYFLPFFEHIRLQILQESLIMYEGALLLTPDFISSYIYMNYYGELERVIKNNNVASLASTWHISLQKALQDQRDPKLIYGLTKLWLEHTDLVPNHALLASSHQIMAAKKIGLTNDEDILAYSFYSLLSGKELIAYEEVADAVNLAIKGLKTLNGSFDTFSQAVWNKIGIQVTGQDSK